MVIYSVMHMLGRQSLYEMKTGRYVMSQHPGWMNWDLIMRHLILVLSAPTSHPIPPENGGWVPNWYKRSALLEAEVMCQKYNERGIISPNNSETKQKIARCLGLYFKNIH